MEKIVKYVPFISGLLLLLGYLNYTSYYKYFDIQISTYLTPGELLLSFLPLTIPILSTIGFLSMYLIMGLFLLTKKKEDDKESKDNNLFLFMDQFSKLSIAIKQKKYKSFSEILTIVLNVFYGLLGLTFIGFFVGYFILLWFNIISKNPIVEIEAFIFILFSFFWIFLLFDLIEKVDDIDKLNNKWFIKFFFISLIFIGCFWLKNKDEAKKVLNGYPEYEVSFTINNKPIKTDNNIVFVGKTINYIFLRNIKDCRNIVYPLDDIITIEFKKIDYKKKDSTH